MAAMVIEIGRCFGCSGRGRLQDGACAECAKRPREWLDRARKCRHDPEFARKVYESIATRAGRELFVRNFGLPSGVRPEGPSLVK